ncbi:carbohydrate ABC transporter permease [Paenibacillus sp. GXUN7292]|uniref:carbohydrate ABC transporter permease n=1 Tax=Paenibacillus sp. GXUN7292 TaxID=3422499 RepID=UPI003D7C90E9
MARKLLTNKNDLLFVVIVYGLLIISMLLVVFPFLYVIFSSFSTKAEYISRGFYIFPKEWTLNSYGYLLNHRGFLASFSNTFYISIVGTMINVIITCLMAYGLSKQWLKGRAILNFLVLFSMIFNGGIIPTYMIVKELGLIDSYWSLFLSGAIAPFILIIMRSFFSTIPSELEEAARMDGCNEWRLLFRIAIPLSLPSIITISLMYGVAHWNSYFQAILYLNSSSKWPVQVFLRQLLLESDSAMELNIGAFEYGPPVQMAAVIATALPLLVCYPFLQKYFNKGMLVGSVKG